MKKMTIILLGLLLVSCTTIEQAPPTTLNSEADVIAAVSKALQDGDYQELRVYDIPNNLPPEMDVRPLCFGFKHCALEMLPGNAHPRPRSHETMKFRIIAQEGDIVWLRVADKAPTGLETWFPIVKKDGKFYFYKPMYEKK